MSSKTKKNAEFGDFQTPHELSLRVCKLLKNNGLSPSSVLEPNCGKGSFVFSAKEVFPSIDLIHAFDINQEYINMVILLSQTRNQANVINAKVSDFFSIDWPDFIGKLEEPILIIGNPPWVTSSELGILHSKNLPQKSNFLNFNGFDAITGKSNFDISEWMLIKLLESIRNKNATIAMLCKTAVARKIIKYASQNDIMNMKYSIYYIDAKKYFNAAVDACLFVCQYSKRKNKLFACKIFDNMKLSKASRTIGVQGGNVISNVNKFRKWEFLQGRSSKIWRSGVKHDCSKIMELSKDGKTYTNGFGRSFELEDMYIYPLLKSSDLANGSVQKPRLWVIVTQKSVKEDTLSIKTNAPKTWEYLNIYKEYLDKRSSRIYRNRPKFSVFGIGDYSFAGYKIAISGFYNSLKFKLLQPLDKKPIMVDDTCYFISCRSKEEAEFYLSLLNSTPAQEFYESQVFWDEKRPINKDILSRLNFKALAIELNLRGLFNKYSDDNVIQQNLNM